MPPRFNPSVKQGGGGLQQPSHCVFKFRPFIHALMYGRVHAAFKIIVTVFLRNLKPLRRVNSLCHVVLRFLKVLCEFVTSFVQLAWFKLLA